MQLMVQSAKVCVQSKHLELSCPASGKRKHPFGHDRQGPGGYQLLSSLLNVQRKPQLETAADL